MRPPSPIKLSIKFIFGLILFVETVFVIKTGFMSGTVDVGVMAQAASEFGSVKEVAKLLNNVDGLRKDLEKTGFFKFLDTYHLESKRADMDHDDLIVVRINHWLISR